MVGRTIVRDNNTIHCSPRNARLDDDFIRLKNTNNQDIFLTDPSFIQGSSADQHNIPFKISS